MPVDLLNAEEHDLDRLFGEWGWPRFRANQVRDWIFNRLVTDPAAMTNLSKLDREFLAQNATIGSAEVVADQLSSDGTRKLLLRWPDGAVAETVMIPDGPRRTACVSSQNGCPVGCKFCASGLNGVKGNLTAGQIVEQVLRLNFSLAREPNAQRITNIVFMGMGEPLANYANVMSAVRILHDPKAFNLGARRITISTVGVPLKMRELAREELPLNLAISLHAPSEALRRELIPWAEHFSIDEILDAARYYFDQTGREITLEYILLAGVNDRPEHARQLAGVCRSLRANVNLIRYNEVAPLPFKRPSTDDVISFQTILRNASVNVHIRKSRGRDIDAACGQLRRKQSETDLVQIGMMPGLRNVNSSPRTKGEAGKERFVSAGRNVSPSAARPKTFHTKRSAFTLVEFLVLIGIALILISIFLPYVLRIRENDRRVRCQRNLSQIFLALRSYAGTNQYVFPRVVYDAANNPNGYAAFTGPDDDNPFAPNSHVKPNDVTASLWLLVRQRLLDPGVFVCPSSDDSRDLLTDAGGRFVTAQQRGNFRHSVNLSYSYSSPFSGAPNYRMDDNRKGDFAILADKSPGIGGESPGGVSGAMVSITKIDDSITGPAWNAPVLQRSRANSRNHGKAGQNVLFASGAVSFERTVFCGVGRSSRDNKPGDNIYTALWPTPLLNENRPAEGNGYWSNEIGPAWEGDSYLVPTADENPDAPAPPHPSTQIATTHAVEVPPPATGPIKPPTPPTPMTPTTSSAPPATIPATAPVVAPPPATVPTSAPAH